MELYESSLGGDRKARIFFDAEKRRVLRAVS